MVPDQHQQIVRKTLISVYMVPVYAMIRSRVIWKGCGRHIQRGFDDDDYFADLLPYQWEAHRGPCGR